jgi:hypothetical protein
MMLLAPVLLACFGLSEDPCAEYCDGVCACSDADSCDECHAVYDGADAALQDECEAALDSLAACDTGG